MYVCLCNGYTDSQIRDAVHDGGVNTPEEVYQALGNGFCCGSCRDCASSVVDEELPKRRLAMAE